MEEEHKEYILAKYVGTVRKFGNSHVVTIPKDLIDCGVIKEKKICVVLQKACLFILAIVNRLIERFERVIYILYNIVLSIVVGVDKDNNTSTSHKTKESQLLHNRPRSQNPLAI